MERLSCFPTKRVKPAAGEQRRGTLSASGVYASIGCHVAFTKVLRGATMGRLGCCETHTVKSTYLAFSAPGWAGGLCWPWLAAVVTLPVVRVPDRFNGSYELLFVILR